MSDSLSGDTDALAELARTLYRLDEAQRRIRTVTARRSALTGIELTALLAVGTTPGLSPTALSQDLGLTTGGVTALVDRLEDSGHVHRVSHSHDRRRLELALTAAGREAIHGMGTAYQAILDRADIRDRAQGLVESLRRVIAALDASAGDADPARP
jgi:DNA-binding MarR family transcriptional regulator